MITWNTSRDRTYFETSVEVYGSFSSGATTGSFTSYVTNVTPTYSYEYSVDSFSTASQSTSSASDGVTKITQPSYTAEIGFTSSSYKRATGTAGGFSTFGSTWVSTLRLVTTSTTTQSISLITSTTYTDSISIYTSSIDSASKTILATSTAAATFTGNGYTSSYSYDDGEWGTYSDTYSIDATTTASITVASTKFATVTLTAPAEIGTIASAVGADWLFKFTTTSSLNPAGLSNLAISFTKETFWPSTTVSGVEFFTDMSVVTWTTGTAPLYANYSVASSSWSNGASTTGFTTQTISSNSTSSKAYTTGSMLPRASSTLADVDGVISTGSFSGGFQGSTGKAPFTAGGLGSGTYTTITISNVNSTSASTLLTKGSTTVSTVRITTTASYSFTTAYPNAPFQSYYIPSVSLSSILSGSYAGTYSFTSSRGYTRTLATAISASKLGFSVASFFEQIPAPGGMQSPDAMSQGDSTGTNISLAPAIYYPFASSVQKNVVIPVISNGSAVQRSSTSSTTWNYSWKDFVLSWTSKFSSLAGTSTVVNSTSSTASLVVDGDNSKTNYQDGGTVFGGFSPVSTAQELGVFPIGVVRATSYDAGGSFTTETIVRTSFNTSNLKDTVRIETVLPAFTLTTVTGGGLPIFSTTRS